MTFMLNGDCGHCIPALQLSDAYKTGDQDRLERFILDGKLREYCPECEEEVKIVLPIPKGLLRW